MSGSNTKSDQASKKLDDVVANVHEVDPNDSSKDSELDYAEYEKDVEHFGSKRVYHSWLLLCYSTGPVAAMSRTYVNAAIQSMANQLGKTKAGATCKPTGSDCYVKFGAGTVNYTAYVTYLRAMYTALDGILCLFAMGVVDYANYKKWALIASITVYGALALPFAGLADVSFKNLTAMSSLYAGMNILDLIYQLIEGSYIPLIIHSAVKNDNLTEERKYRKMLTKGSTVSIMGLFLANCGGLTAQVIGVIMSYTRGVPAVQGYSNFLLATTAAGCITVVFSIFSSFFIPNTKAKPYPKGEFVLTLSVKRFWKLLKSIQQYRMAFLYCSAWVIWYVAYSNFLTNFNLLFRSTLGLGSSDSEYTVFTFMSYIVAMVGAIVWMFIFRKFEVKPKTWGYVFYGISIFSNFWGCLGITLKTTIGFKNRWEFWLFEIVFTAAAAAFRGLNRALYSTLLPHGDEAQYFGLETMLAVAASAFGTLVNAAIQDKTGNYHLPFAHNLILLCIACFIFWMVDLDKGRKMVEKDGVIFGGEREAAIEEEIEAAPKPKVA